MIELRGSWNLIWAQLLLLTFICLRWRPRYRQRRRPISTLSFGSCFATSLLWRLPSMAVANLAKIGIWCRLINFNLHLINLIQLKLKLLLFQFYFFFLYFDSLFFQFYHLLRFSDALVGVSSRNSILLGVHHVMVLNGIKRWHMFEQKVFLGICRSLGIVDFT